LFILDVIGMVRPRGIKQIAMTMVSALVCVGLLLSVASCASQNDGSAQHLDSLPVRTDSEPLISRFPLLYDSGECYWKADTLGRGSIGSSNYFMVGFVTVSESVRVDIISRYLFKELPSNSDFRIAPQITGRAAFDWGVNEDFEKEFLGNGFMGTVYFDSIGGIVYFDIQNL
jgi:hypothetical protein